MRFSMGKMADTLEESRLLLSTLEDQVNNNLLMFKIKSCMPRGQPQSNCMHCKVEASYRLVWQLRRTQGHS